MLSFNSKRWVYETHSVDTDWLAIFCNDLNYCSRLIRLQRAPRALVI